MINPPQVLPEEPTAVTPHGGFCGGKSQQWLRYPTNPHVRICAGGVRRRTSLPRTLFRHRPRLDRYVLMPEAVRKPFRGPSGRKIDSNGTPHTHQRFAEAATSILLLRANNHFERFHTTCTPLGGS